jgi:hypothetical protein
MSNQFGTRFSETEALLAVQSEDIGAAEDILREMLAGELTALAAAARELAEMCHSMARIKAREVIRGSHGAHSDA